MSEMIWNQAKFEYESSYTPSEHKVNVILKKTGKAHLYTRVADLQTGFINGVYAHRMVFEDGSTATFSAQDWKFQEKAWRDIF